MSTEAYAPETKNLTKMLGHSNKQKNITTGDYVLYLFLHGLKKYTENAENAAGKLGWAIGLAAPYSAMAMSVTYIDQNDMNNSSQACANDGEKFLRPAGKAIGAVIGSIPTVIEALINWATRSLKSHDDVTRSIARLEAMKDESFSTKHRLIQSVITAYEEKTNKTSKGSATLLDQLAEEKPINDHIQSLIDYTAQHNERGLLVNNGKNMFLRICDSVDPVDVISNNPEIVHLSENNNESTSFNTRDIANTSRFLNDLFEDSAFTASYDHMGLGEDEEDVPPPYPQGRTPQDPPLYPKDSYPERPPEGSPSPEYPEPEGSPPAYSR